MGLKIFLTVTLSPDVFLNTKIHKTFCSHNGFLTQSMKACLQTPAPIAQLVECPLRGTGGHGFDPGPRNTKVVKHGTNCSSLGTQTYGVKLGLVDPVSG